MKTDDLNFDFKAPWSDDVKVFTKSGDNLLQISKLLGEVPTFSTFWT
jgi:hypothetical protein